MKLNLIKKSKKDRFLYIIGKKLSKQIKNQNQSRKLRVIYNQRFVMINSFANVIKTFLNNYISKINILDL